MSSNISPPVRDRACDRCLARSWLIERLGGHLDKAGPKAADVLALSDDELIAALAGKRQDEVRRELLQLDVASLRRCAESAGLELICRCDPAYPAGLRSLQSAPAVLHVAGDLERALALAAARGGSDRRGAASLGIRTRRCALARAGSRRVGHNGDQWDGARDRLRRPCRRADRPRRHGGGASGRGRTSPIQHRGGLCTTGSSRAVRSSPSSRPGRPSGGGRRWLAIASSLRWRR